MRIISMDGGGFLGLSSAQFLAELERHFGAHCAERFDLFCGTSTGALIALLLAAGKSAAEVVNFYEAMGPQVFPREGNLLRWWRTNVRAWHSAKYSPEPLKAALETAFGDLRLRDLKNRGKYVLVTAFCVSNGQPRVFKTDHSSNLSGHDDYLVRDVALASSAAPTYFPMVELRSPTTGVLERFCDGGIFANAPALIGFAEALHELRVPANEVAILSVAAPTPDWAEHASARSKAASILNRGLLGWRRAFPGVLIDATSNISNRALERIVKATSAGQATLVRVRPGRPAGLDLDVATTAAIETLKSIGAEMASTAETRNSLKLFFQD